MVGCSGAVQGQVDRLILGQEVARGCMSRMPLLLLLYVLAVAVVAVSSPAPSDWESEELNVWPDHIIYGHGVGHVTYAMSIGQDQ